MDNETWWNCFNKEEEGMRENDGGGEPNQGTL
jgi:hypothetical protein